jgi:hypothetical protein
MQARRGGDVDQWDGWAGFSWIWAGFSRFGLFREILCELFIDLDRNWKRKSAIPREIRGIGARKFVAMQINTQDIKSMDQNHKKLNKSRDQNSRQFWGYFFLFPKFMVEITNKSKSVATKSC